MNTNFVIMGLPASGKTTFLAALWHVIEAGEIPSRLKLKSYEGDLAYLNMIAEAWRNFKKVPRTSQIGDVDVTINFLDEQTDVEGTAFFPDLAGETFDTQVEARRCRPKFIDYFGENNGILFFISADVKGEALSIVELNSFLPKTDVQPEEGGVQHTTNSIDIASVAEWSPRMVSAQVRVVQILSDLLRHPFTPCKRRIALIISAWDLVDGDIDTPDMWLESKMPLVSQFLKTNVGSFDCRLFGISAQGASLDDSEAVQKIADNSASCRVRVVGAVETENDLTMPLVWLMSKE